MARKGGLNFFSAAVNISRLLVAACLIFSGFVKAVDPVGTQIKIQDYMSAFGIGGLTSSDVLIAACVLAGFEFLLGVYLLFGIYRHGTSVCLMAIVSAFTALTLYLALKNPVSDCGCFGDALVLTNWQTFCKNLFLLVLSIHILVSEDRIRPLIRERRSWLVTLVTVLLIGHFMFSNIRNLPVFDYRPYKVGTNIREAVSKGDDRFGDFFMMDDAFDDQTEVILNSPGFTFLLVSPFLEEASQENIDLINDMYYYCKDAGYPMYGVTASGIDEIEHWKDVTYGEYDFLQADDILLKTMIRSNPGVVVLRDGVIAAKWSDWNIPLDSHQSVRMEQLGKAHPLLSVRYVRNTFIAFYFILPYLLVLLIDWLCRKKRFDKHR